MSSEAQKPEDPADRRPWQAVASSGDGSWVSKRQAAQLDRARDYAQRAANAFANGTARPEQAQVWATLALYWQGEGRR